MPKEITHWTLAEKAYQSIEPDSVLKKIIRRYKNLYLAGAVIPDTPFYQICGRNRKIMYQLGKNLHDHPLNSYAPLANVIKRYSSPLPDDVLAILLGFLSHIHADSSFHPMVYYFSGTNMRGPKKSRDEASVFHHTLEAYIDIYYTGECRPPNRGLFSELMKRKEMEETRFLKVLSVLFSEDQTISVSDIRETLRLHAGIQKLFDNNAIKIILELLDSIPGADLSVYRSSFYPLRKPEPDSIFLRPFSYRHPVTGEKLEHTVKELEKKAVRETLNIFRLIEYHLTDNSLARAFPGLKGPNLSTGLTDIRAADMRWFGTGEDLMKLIFH